MIAGDKKRPLFFEQVFVAYNDPAAEDEHGQADHYFQEIVQQTGVICVNITELLLSSERNAEECDATEAKSGRYSRATDQNFSLEKPDFPFIERIFAAPI